MKRDIPNSNMGLGISSGINYMSNFKNRAYTKTKLFIKGDCDA